MAVLRANPVGRCALGAEHLDDLNDMILLAYDAAVYDKAVTLTGMHSDS